MDGLNGFVRIVKFSVEMPLALQTHSIYVQRRRINSTENTSESHLDIRFINWFIINEKLANDDWIRAFRFGNSHFNPFLFSWCVDQVADFIFASMIDFVEIQHLKAFVWVRIFDIFRYIWHTHGEHRIFKSISKTLFHPYSGLFTNATNFVKVLWANTEYNEPLSYGTECDEIHIFIINIAKWSRTSK